MYPVNTLSYNPVSKTTLASGGGDGSLNIWDASAKKRLSYHNDYQTSIAAVDWSCDGKVLGIACSYTFEEGERDHPADAILIKSFID